jgi:hypothetical protein
MTLAVRPALPELRYRTQNNENYSFLASWYGLLISIRTAARTRVWTIIMIACITGSLITLTRIGKQIREL